ncbi:MAG: cytochrome c [Desulfobacterales bacterium]|jgi:mono/diheme cytochrome c family protein
MKRFLVILIPILLIVAVYHLLIFYDNRFPHGRMKETPAVKPYEKRVLIMEQGVVPASGGEMSLRAVPADRLTAPFDLTDPAVAAAGRTVYLTYCQQCHGPNYDGNGTVGQSFHPLPTDLRSQKAQSMSGGELFHTISYGLPDGRQPPLYSTITVADRWRSVAFVKSLGIR